MSYGALKRRRNYRDETLDKQMTATDDDQTLISVKNVNYTIYIQRIIAYITTDAAQSWNFKDSNGTPKSIAKVTTSPGADTRWDFDFGDEGVPLNQGKDFLLDVSAVGLAGNIHVEAYQRLTAVTNSNAGPSLQ